jgi:antirestriction protein ArdC
MKKEEIQGIVRRGIDILAKSLALGQSDTLGAYLETMARFPQYSLHNAMLIAMQRPHARRVAGFHAWRQLGRHVKRGEKGISILAPIVIRQETDDQDEDETIFAFKAAYVFDVEQTQGKELPEFARPQGDPGRYLDELRQFVRESGITLEYSEGLGSTFGLSASGKIILQTGLSPGEEFSVLVHELAHEMLHQASGEVTNRTVKETEAEAVAFVVSEAIGLDSQTASSDYIQLYDGDKNVLMESLHRIHGVAAEILGSIGVIEGRKKRSEAEKPVAVRAAA